jgi:hypothetical protein
MISKLLDHSNYSSGGICHPTLTNYKDLNSGIT